jgi:hypothetical protein
MSITIDTAQILALCAHAGIVVDLEKSGNDDYPEWIEQQFELRNETRIVLPDGRIYTGESMQNLSDIEDEPRPLQDIDSHSHTVDPDEERFTQLLSDDAHTSNYLPEHRATFQVLSKAGVDLSPLIGKKQ